MATQTKILLVIFLLISFFFYWAFGVTMLDPDFGWHIKMGEIISSSGIPKTDPFSYTMPSFPFIDHEWLTNLLIYKLYPLIGMNGLSIIYSLLALSSLIIVIPKKSINFSLVPLILSSAILISFFGIRPQVETWFFLAILVKVILDQNLWARYKYFLPLLTILWVNLHGGFAIGLTIILFSIIIRSFQVKKIVLSDLGIGFASILATFINPYGSRIWEEVIMQITDSSLRFSIAEWLPILLNFNLPFIIWVAFSTALVAKYQKILTWHNKLLFFGILLIGLSSSRHIPLWTIMSLPISTFCLSLLNNESHKNKVNLARFNQLHKIFLWVSLAVFWAQLNIQLASYQFFAENNFYPVEAINFLKERTSEGNLFSIYDWGGYLIWKLPQQKVYIDGRMPSWRWDRAPNRESNYAFKDYQKTLYDKEKLDQELAKYHITAVLWPVRENVHSQNKNNKLQFFSSLKNLLTIKRGENRKVDFINNLKDRRWQITYQDEVSIILEQPKQ